MDTEGGEDVAAVSLRRLAETSAELNRRIGRLMERSGAAGYARTVPLERRMQMVEDITAAIKALARDGHRFRRAEVRALYAEGLTMAQLAVVFGVSRQRVSMLLRGDVAERMEDTAVNGTGHAVRP